MDAILKTQAKLRQDMGLSRVPLASNADYKPNGTKSFVTLMAKLKFAPTKPGPYVFVNRMHQRGLAGSGIAVGGRAHMEKVLMRKLDGPDANGDTFAQVTADDLQLEPVYLCEVDIGKPARKLRLEPDTSSAKLWVHAAATAGSGPSRSTAYDPGNSSTFKSLSGKTWRHDFGGGLAASGEVGTDLVAIGGLVVKDQAVHLATSLDGRLTEHADGSLGLGPGMSSSQTSFMAKVASGADIPREAQLFTTFLCDRPGQMQGQQQSFATFGYIDPDMVKQAGSDISWANIDANKDAWMVPSGSASVNGSQVPRQVGNMAMVDTASPLVLVGDDVCDAVYSQIKGATYSSAHQGFLIPKSTDLAALPRFAVAVGDGELAIKSELVFAEADSGYWYGSVQSRGENPFDVLGVPFLESVYAVWDQGNRRFGYVPKK